MGERLGMVKRILWTMELSREATSTTSRITVTIKGTVVMTGNLQMDCSSMVFLTGSPKKDLLVLMLERMSSSWPKRPTLTMGTMESNTRVSPRRKIWRNLRNPKPFHSAKLYTI